MRTHFSSKTFSLSLVSSATDSASSLINIKLRCSRTTIALVPHAFLDLFCQLLHQVESMTLILKPEWPCYCFNQERVEGKWCSITSEARLQKCNVLLPYSLQDTCTGNRAIMLWGSSNSPWRGTMIPSPQLQLGFEPAPSTNLPVVMRRVILKVNPCVVGASKMAPSDGILTLVSSPPSPYCRLD